MYSKKESKEVQDFMKDLGFPSNEESELIENVVKTFSGKVIILKKSNLQIVGKLHSATQIFGNHLNLTDVKESECSTGILEELHYYHPRNFKSELGQRNFGFVSAAFNEDPEKTDLLVVPIDGVTLVCENKTITFPTEEEIDE